MPWPFRHRATSSPELTAIQQVQVKLDDLQKSIDTLAQRLTIVETSSSNEHLAQQIENLIDTLSSPGYVRPSQIAIVAAIDEAIEKVYDWLRGSNQYYARPPIELPLGTSASYVLPLDPRYHYQLLISNPIHPEATATLIIIPKSYAEAHELPPLPNGIQRRAFNIDEQKAPPKLVEAIRLLHAKLWPTMYLVERHLLSDGKVESRYWRCVRRTHDRDLLRFPNHLCLYFEFMPEGETIVTDIEIPAQPLSSFSSNQSVFASSTDSLNHEGDSE